MNLFSLDLVQHYDILLMKVLCTTHWRAEPLKSLLQIKFKIFAIYEFCV